VKAKSNAARIIAASGGINSATSNYAAATIPADSTTPSSAQAVAKNACIRRRINDCCWRYMLRLLDWECARL
jgi:hypothetical protein